MCSTFSLIPPDSPGSTPASGARCPSSGTSGGGGGPFDAAAFEAFAAAQMERIDAWARVFCVPVHLAEDFLQEALLCVWEQRERMAACKWPAWLWKAMLVRKARHARKQGRAREHEPVYAAAVVDEWLLRASPETAMYQQQCERELLRLVEHVKEGRREVVQRYLLDEEPMEAIAEKLGVPLETARTRWKLGLRDMRAELSRSRAAARSRGRAKDGFWLLLGSMALWLRRFGARLLGREPGGDGELGGEARKSGNGPMGGDRTESVCSTEARRPARWLAVAAVLGVVALCTCSSDAPMVPFQVSDVEEATASAGLSPSIGVFLPAWAEHEKEWGDGRASSGRAGSSGELARSVDRAATRRSASRNEVEGARSFLARASAALQENDRAAARVALGLYEVAYPENPYPVMYRALWAAVAAP